MREFKFRAWKDGEEVGFEYLSHETMCGSVFNISVAGCDSYFDAIDNCLIEQYTGLKDKNNVEIYEGDILYSEEVYFKVKWSEKGACFGLVYYNNDPANEGFYSYVMKEFEVVGNIHQNSELLEKQNERV